MAIGQLLDYSRFIDPTPGIAALLPSRPRNDLLDLLHHCGVSVIYPSGDGFAEESP
jgi:hypothetical protein